jgi:hypothetical protein
MLSIQNGSSSAGVPSIGTDFLVANVELLNSSSIRVWYTRSPVLGTNKANDAHSYSILGPGPLSITIASYVAVRPLAIDLFFNTTLTAGQYTLSFVNGNIISNDSSALALTSGTTYVFQVVNANIPANTLATDNNLTKKFMNPAFLGKDNWESLIATLEDNREKLSDTVTNVFDQIFISTASGKYLNTRSSDYGISHSSILGLPDDVARKLTITILNDKLTQNANLDLLEILYGTPGVKANLTSAVSEPFRLFNGATLNLLIDGKYSVSIVFQWSDFVNALVATAEEVCFIINKVFNDFGLKAFASPYTDPETLLTYVRIFSGTNGLRSSIAVTSGSAQNAFQFSNLLFSNLNTTAIPSASVKITDLPLGKAKIEITRTDPLLDTIFNTIVIGDYINILGSEFNLGNRGSFVIESITNPYVSSHFVGALIVSNITAINETIAPGIGSVYLYHPVTAQIFDNTNYAYITNQNYIFSNTHAGYSTASVPVNTEIIDRDISNAAYCTSFTKNTETSIYRDPSGIIHPTVSYPANAFVEITEFLAKLPVAADFLTTAGTPATPSTATGISDLSKFSRGVNDTFLSGGSAAILPLCVSDLNNNVIVIGGRHAATDTGQNSVSVCHLNTTSINGNYDFQYNYTWTRTAFAGKISPYGASAVCLDYPRFWNQILIAGGYPNGTTHAVGSGYVESRTFLYNSATNKCNEITGTSTGGIADAALVWMGGSYNLAVLVGGRDSTGNAVKKCSVWDPSYSTGSQLGQWDQGSGNELKVARTQCQAIDISNGKVLVVGGKTVTGTDAFTLNVEYPLNSCEILQPTVAFSIPPSWTGSMSYARYAFGMTMLPDGRVLVVGGIGNLPSQPQSPTNLAPSSELSSCEVFDKTLSIWSPIPSMLEPHSYCSCHYDNVTNRVYVCGGSSSTAVEYLDVATMTWHYSIAKLPNVSFRGNSCITKTTPPILVRPSCSAYAAGVETDGTGTTFVALYNETARSNGINGIQQINGSGLYQSSVAAWTSSDTSGASILVSVEDTTPTNGPYIYDTNQPFGITGQELTIQTEIPRGKGCPVVTITEDLSLLPQSGYVVVNFGYEDQEGPVKYSIISTGSLVLDPSFRFNHEHIMGTKLTVVSQKAPYLPTVSEQTGAFYLTASNSGLSAARKYITDISATGIDLNINVRYPGDRGLGNEGQPVKSNYKLSDIIEVFGPDNLDPFLEEMRHE